MQVLSLLLTHHERQVRTMGVGGHTFFFRSGGGGGGGTPTLSFPISRPQNFWVNFPDTE